jgi:addiction module HigA family antidote
MLGEAMALARRDTASLISCTPALLVPWLDHQPSATLYATVATTSEILLLCAGFNQADSSLMKTTIESSGRMHSPAHPGEILKEMYMTPLGVTVTKVADALGVTRKHVSAIVNGRAPVTPERAIRRLEFSGMRIVATSDGYDSTSKARKVHRGFKGLMNEIFLDDLRERVHRGLAGQAMKHYWCGGRPYGYRLKPVLDPSRLDVYGQPSRIGTVLEIEDEQAGIVREIFARYAEGASCLAISRELNARGIASPGSTWKRKSRRCRGWMGSAVTPPQQPKRARSCAICWGK